MRLSALFLVAFGGSGVTLVHAVDDADVRKCRDIRDAAARLSCYDALQVGPAPAQAPSLFRPQLQPIPGTAPAPGQAPVPRMSPPAPAAATQGTQEAQFGLPAKAGSELLSIHSYIPGVFSGWGPNYRIRLANGQVWQVVDDSRGVLERRDPKVTVRRGALGSFYMDFEGDNRSPRVRRVE